MKPKRDDSSEGYNFRIHMPICYAVVNLFVLLYSMSKIDAQNGDSLSPPFREEIRLLPKMIIRREALLTMIKAVSR